MAKIVKNNGRKSAPKSEGKISNVGWSNFSDEGETFSFVVGSQIDPNALKVCLTRDDALTLIEKLNQSLMQFRG